MKCMYTGCSNPGVRVVSKTIAKCEAHHRADIEAPWGSVTRSPEPIEMTSSRPRIDVPHE